MTHQNKKHFYNIAFLNLDSFGDLLVNDNLASMPSINKHGLSSHKTNIVISCMRL